MMHIQKGDKVMVRQDLEYGMGNGNSSLRRSLLLRKQIQGIRH